MTTGKSQSDGTSGRLQGRYDLGYHAVVTTVHCQKTTIAIGRLSK